MSKSTHAARAERINVAFGLIQKYPQISDAVADMIRFYGLSKRQAYRYLERAKQLTEPIPVPDQKIAFTVKLSIGLIQKLRQHAKLRDLKLSELVGQALEAFLHPGRGLGYTWLHTHPIGYARRFITDKDGQSCQVGI